jgi:hypothetical protein
MSSILRLEYHKSRVLRDAAPEQCLGDPVWGQAGEPGGSHTSPGSILLPYRQNYKIVPKTIASFTNCWYNLHRWRKNIPRTPFTVFPQLMDVDDLNIGSKEVFFMVTNCDFGRSSLLAEQYQREMELIAVALQEESQDERDERLNLVARSWSLTTACFHAQLESSEAPAYASVAFAHP